MAGAEYEWAYKDLQSKNPSEIEKRVDGEIMAQLTPRQAVALSAKAKDIRDAEILPGEHRVGKLLRIKKRLVNQYISGVRKKYAWEARQKEIDSWGPGEHAPLSEQWLPDDYSFPEK